MLNLYQNVTPNLSGTHYYFKNFTAYLNLLASNLLKTIDNDRYDINKGFIRVKLGTDITEANYKQVTYIINTTDNKCYHVASQVVQSGYVIYNVNTDLWASYIKDAELKNINVRKCNRKINNDGIYDEISNAKELTFNNIQTGNVDLVIRLKHKRGSQEQGGAGSYGLSQELYAIGLSGQSLSEIIYALENVTKFRVIPPRGAQVQNFAQAEVTGLWLIPSELLEFNQPADTTYKVVYHQLASGSEVESTFNLVLLKVAYKTKQITLPFETNKDYLVGTYNLGIKARRSINNNFNITYHVVTKAESISVLVSDGNIQEDITSGFSFTSYTTEDNTAEQLEKLTNTINRIASLASGLVTTGVGVLSSNPLAVALGLGRTTRGITGLMGQNNEPKTQQKAVGGGDGYSNFQLGSIFGYSVSTSIINEEKRARKTGANFNQYVDDIEDIFDYDLIGTGEANDDTFVIATLDANNIPTNAITYIESIFASGVYLQLLTNENK